MRIYKVIPHKKYPRQFKEYANIEKEVIISGVGNYFEIWNPKNFAEYQRNASEHFLSDLENIGKYLDMSKIINVSDEKNGKE